MKIFPNLAVAGFMLLTIASCMKDNSDNTVFVNATDNNFLTATSYHNYGEIETGIIAMSSAMSDSVKMFAQMMVADYTAAQATLDSLTTELKITMPQVPDTTQFARIRQLSNLSGYAFDTIYIGQQLIDHQNAISLLEDELRNGSNGQIKGFAEALLPKIKMHYTMALGLSK